MESNDSPEIPDRGETSDIPGLPSGVAFAKNDFGCMILTFLKAARLIGSDVNE